MNEGSVEPNPPLSPFLPIPSAVEFKAVNADLVGYMQSAKVLLGCDITMVNLDAPLQVHYLPTWPQILRRQLIDKQND